MKAEFPVEALPKSEVLKGEREKFVDRWREYAKGDEFQIERLTKILDAWDEMISISVAHEDKIR
ncbi:MAG: hypothetical protein AAF585_07090 [Verrucomicrobiota bacterium]